MLTAALIAPTTSLPVARYDYPWDGRLARARVLDWCKKKIHATPTTKEIEPACAKRAFLLQRQGEPDYTREAWDLPYADVIDDQLVIVPRGVKALASGHGIVAVDDISEADRQTAMRYVCDLYDRVRRVHVEMPDCPFKKEKPVTSSIETLVAAGIADPAKPWDGAGAQSRIIAHCNGKPDSCWKSAYLAPGDTPSASKFPVYDVVDGDLVLVPKALIAAAGRLNQAQGVDTGSLKSKICSLYSQVQSKYPDFPDCPLKDSKDDGESMDAAAKKKKKDYDMGFSYSRTAAGVPVVDRSVPLKPPMEWFAPVATITPMPLTIQSDGRVMGHGALWDSCHAGYTDRCVPVPHSAQDYKFFHRGAVETEDGVLVAVGHLTVGGGHAGPNGDLVAASEHYDDATATVAVVAAHEDRWGIFLAGALVPDASPEQVAMLRRSPLSGDWRAFDGNLEMVAMHAVNVPGFGVDRPRTAVAASGTLIFPGPYAEVEEEPDEAVETRIALAASFLIGEKE